MGTSGLCLAFLLFVGTTESSSGNPSYNSTQCFTVDGNFEHGTNPGAFHPSSITPDVCKTLCGDYGYRYAALTGGRLCFCKNASSEGIPATNCQAVCPGDPTQQCGGNGYVSLYPSSSPVTAISISSNTNGRTVTTGTKINFTLSSTRIGPVYYRIDFDDGAGLEGKTQLELFSRIFRRPGTYSVAVEANDLTDTLTGRKAVTTVQVQAPVKDVTVECDAVFETHQEGNCVVTIWQGAGLSLSVSTVPPTTTQSFPTIADPELTWVGPGIPLSYYFPHVESNQLSTVVVAQDSLVERPGRVLYWEMYINTTGLIKILILSPNCTGGLYSVVNYECVYSPAANETGDSVSCSNHSLCQSNGRCDDGQSTPPSRFLNGFLKVPRYTVKASVGFTASGTGYWTFFKRIPETVSPGDILAWDVGSSTGSLRFLNCSADRNSLKYTSSGFNFESTDMYPIANRCVALRILVSGGSRVYMPYSFTTEDLYTLQVNASNSVTTGLTGSTNVTALSRISFATINGPTYIRTGVPTQFSLQSHASLLTLYTWDKGDGTAAILNETQPFANLTYTSRGRYRLNATITNAISSKTNTSIVLVQDGISGLLVVPQTPVATVNKSHAFRITLSSGSDYICNWMIENYDPWTTNDSTTPAGKTTTVTHIFTTSGNNTVSVVCSNNVNSMAKTFIQRVQEAITGLNLSRWGQDLKTPVAIPWQVATGTDIRWEVEFNGTSLPPDGVASSPANSRWITTELGILSYNVYTVRIRGSNEISSMSITEQYHVTHAVRGLTAKADKTPTKVEEVVTFTVSMEQGANVIVSFDFKDGQVNEYKTSGLWHKGLERNYTHSFSDGGRFNVQVSAYNPALTNTTSVEVLVLQGVHDVEVYTSGLFPFHPPAEGTFWFDVPSGKPSPTEPELVLQRKWFPDRHSRLELKTNYTEIFDTIGVFNITAIVSNAVNSKLLSFTMTVFDVIEGPQIVTAFAEAPRGQPMDVDFILYRGPTYPLCNLTWDFGNSSSTQSRPRNGEGINGRDNETVTYDHLGTYNITVTATTFFQTVSKTRTIQVIEPVVRKYLRYVTNSYMSGEYVWHFKPGLVDVNITWTNSNLPHLALINIDWGDGVVEQNLAFDNYTKCLQHKFTKSGLFNTTITVFNNASTVDIFFEVGVFKDFEGLAVRKCYKPELPLEAECKPGLYGKGDIFYSNKDVQFNLSTDNGAFATLYEIEMPNGSRVETQTNPFNLTFEPGTWSVTIHAINPLYNGTVSTMVIMVEDIAGLEITDDPDELNYVGMNKTFFIHFETQGSETCLLIDFGDGKKDVYADLTVNCTVYPEFRENTVVGNLTGTTSVYHTYNAERTYTLTAIAKNRFSSASQQINFDISNLACRKTDVEIEEACTDFRHQCQYKRNSYINILTIVRIDCELLNNTKIWTVETVDRYWGNVTGAVNLTASGVVTTMAELAIKPLTLSCGLYKVTFTVSLITPNPDLVFKGSAFSYIEILQSPLMGLMLEGGTADILVGRSGTISFQPLKYSYDPDIAVGSRTSGMNVTKWSLTYQNGGSTTECSTAVQRAQNENVLSLSANCLKNNQKYTVNASLWKQERSTNATANFQVTDGNPVRLVIVCTGGSVCAQQQRGYVVVESARLGLLAKCENCHSGEDLGYSWTISVEDVRWPNGLMPLRAVYLSQGRTAGLQTKQMAIQPSLFAIFSRYKRYRVKCEASSETKTTGWASTVIKLNEPPANGNCSIEPKEVIVTEEKVFRIRCSGWTDDTGIAEFQFFSYYDPETVRTQITSVKVFSGILDVRLAVPLGAYWLDYNNTVMVVVRDTMGAFTEMEIDTVKVFPKRYEGNLDLEMEFRGNLSKVFHEGVQQNATSFVASISTIINSERRQQHADPLAGRSGLTTHPDSHYTSAVRYLFRDTGSFFPGLSTSSTTRTGHLTESTTPAYTRRELKSDAGSETTIQPMENTTSAEMNTTFEEDRDKRAKFRSYIISRLVRLQNNTMLSRSQIMSAIYETLLYPDEVTGDTQSMVVGALLSYVDQLDTIQGVTPYDRNQSMNYLFGNIGLLLDAAGTMGLVGTLTELREAEDSESFGYYPTYNGAPEDYCLQGKSPVYTYDAAYKRHAELLFCRRQRERAKQLSQTIVKIMDKMRASYQKNSVPGERMQFNSDRMRVVMASVYAGDETGRTQKLDYSDAETTLPSNLTELFPDRPVDENETIVIQVGVLAQCRAIHTTQHQSGPAEEADFQWMPQSPCLIPMRRRGPDVYIDNNTVKQQDRTRFQMSENSNTAHHYTKGSMSLPFSTRFISLSIRREDGSEATRAVLHQPITIKIPVSRGMSQTVVHKSELKINHWNKFQFRKGRITKKGSSIHAKVCPESREVQFVVVISLGNVPDPQQGYCNKSFLVPADVTDSNNPNCTYVYMDNVETTDFEGDVYFGLRPLTEDEFNMDVTNCSALPDWSNGLNDSQTTDNYTIMIFTAGCFSFTEGDSDWSSERCRVQAETNENRTVCTCNRLADTFAGGWTASPNTIDWNFVFSNMSFQKNLTLFVTEIVLGILYVFALLWARRKDRKDIEQLGIAPLMDNDPRDMYYYEIVIVTGMRRNAGTDSKVFMVLSGDDDETDVREISDSQRKVFQRGHANGFLMATPRPLGHLNYARIWHDNSGKGSRSSWYLSHMIVKDIQTDKKWVFIVDRWFAVEKDDGQVHRVVPVASHQMLTDFAHIFSERSRRSFTDGHLWFSVVARPPQSRFTRMQRVSCCLCLLFVNMMANAMFYGTTDRVSSGYTFQAGPFSLSLGEVYIGVISNLIVFPINFLIMNMFRKSRARRLIPSRVAAAIRRSQDPAAHGLSAQDVRAKINSAHNISHTAQQRDTSDLEMESLPSRPLSTNADDTVVPNKRRWSLPWWCRIVAWILLWLTTITAFIIVTAYGIQFRDEKVQKWFMAMLISFCMSIFVTQPLKVFLVVVFLSLIFKTSGEDDEEDKYDEERLTLEKDEMLLHSNFFDNEEARPRKAPFRPPRGRMLKQARAKRLQEIKVWASIRELVGYTFFLLLLLVISYRQRSYNLFLYKHTMERVFIRNNETDIDFEKITNIPKFWVWARSGLINGIRAGPYYNNYPPLLLRGYVNDKVSKILGYAVIRQLRIKPNLCELDRRMAAVMLECNVNYNMLQQEDRDFNVSWTPLKINSSFCSGNSSDVANCSSSFSSGHSDNNTASWYRYTTADSLNGYPYWGVLAMYDGGGYVVQLQGSKTDLMALMSKLEEERWIDRYTRAVFIEFTLYNAQVNLFGVATILAEFHPTHGIVPSYRFEPCLLLPYQTPALVFQMVCEGIYCCFILFFVIKLAVAFCKKRLGFFKDFWNLVNLGIVLLSIAAIVVYFYRLFETKRLINRFKVTGDKGYIKFQYVGYWNEIFTYLLGWTLFLATINFSRLLRFNKHVSYLANTLKKSSRSLLHFSIIFWIMFLSFAMLFFLTYMTTDVRYSSFMRTTVTCILMMMGKFDIRTLSMAQPLLSPIYLTLFVLSLTFIIVNMFVSILTETFTDVRMDVSAQDQDYRAVSHIVSRFLGLSGSKKGRVGTAPTTETSDEMKRHEEDLKMDELPERIDHMLKTVCILCADSPGPTSFTPGGQNRKHRA